MLSRSLRIGQFWLLLSLITGLSLTPLPAVTELGVSDKVLHLTAYLVLFVSLDLAHWPRQKLPGKLGGLLFYSALIEVAQSYVPNRFCSLGDLAANLLGLLLGLLAAARVVPLLRAGDQARTANTR